MGLLYIFTYYYYYYYYYYYEDNIKLDLKEKWDVLCVLVQSGVKYGRVSRLPEMKTKFRFT
jgi:hypothetical protein